MRTFFFALLGLTIYANLGSANSSQTTATANATTSETARPQEQSEINTSEDSTVFEMVSRKYREWALSSSNA